MKSADNPTKEFGKVQRAFGSGNLGETRKLLSIFLGRYPNHAGAHEIAGDLAAKNGDWPKALKFYTRASTLDLRSVEICTKLAYAMSEVGEPEDGLFELRKLVARFPGDPAPITVLGEFLASHGAWDSALREFMKAQAAGGKHPNLPQMLVQCLIELNRSSEAIDLLLESSSKAPSPETHTTLGFIYQSQGNFEEAMECFLKAVSLKPSHGPAYFGLGQGRRLTEIEFPIVERASEALREAQPEGPDAMMLHYFLGKAREDANDFESASQHFEAANQLAFQINLKGKPFRLQEYRDLVTKTISEFGLERMNKTDSMPSSSGTTPIFVMGMMRSGTSLLEQILASHEKITGGGELNFWPDHRAKTFHPGQISELRAGYSELISSISKGSQWVIDKMPENYLNLGAIHLAFPNSPIVHVRRNPADTCLSIYTTAYSISPDFAHRPESISAAYQEYLRIMAHWRRVLPTNRLIEIDYEDLVLDREGVVREVLKFADIAWDDRLLRHESNVRMVTTPSVWQVRQPLYHSSVGRWKRFSPWFKEFGDLGGSSEV